VRDRVGVLDPGQPAVRDHEVGLAILQQERRDRADTLLYRPAVLDAAVRADLARDQDVQVAELPGVEQAAEERAQLDA
jgi:hypothetical protein